MLKFLKGFFFFKLFEIKAEEATEIFHLPLYLPDELHQSGLGQAETRSLQLRLPSGWQGPSSEYQFESPTRAILC